MSFASPRNLLRSTPFRLGLIYLALFGGSGGALLGFLYWSTAGSMLREADATIEAEISGLDERYRLTGLGGLTVLIRERLARRPAGSAVYLLSAPDGSVVVGNLDRWPVEAPDAEGWVDFRLENPGAGVVHPARAQVFDLRGGFRLLVGRDMHELEATRSSIIRTLGWGLALTAALALGGAVLMSRSRIRRLAAVNQAMREIMEGDLSRRIPDDGTGDDIDQLVAGLNRMVAEVENLVAGVRRVSDNIAHDLRTPLASLRNRLESLQRDMTPEERREGLDHAIEATDRLLATFNALLRIARIESLRRRAGFTDVDLAAVLGDVADFYRPAAEEAGRGLELQAENAPVIRADRDLLFQALANVVENAIKYSPEATSILLSLRRLPDAVELVVADSGPGIPEAERGRVFQRFYRLEPHRSTPGNGLGLSLVAAVARLHDATVRLEDNDPGLRFVLSLPLQTPSDSER